jgi:hypothetical protein
MTRRLSPTAFVWLASLLAGCGFDKDGLGRATSAPDASIADPVPAPPDGPTIVPPAPVTPPDASADAANPAVAADAAPSIAPPAVPDARPAGAVPGECDTIPRPVRFTMQPATESGDLTFDGDGFLVLPAERNIMRLTKGGAATTLVANALGVGRIVYGLRVLADGALAMTDDRSDFLTRFDSGGARREITMDAPLQFATGPGGMLYVTGDAGDLFLVDPVAGRTTVIGRSTGTLRGITFSPDFKTLYVVDRRSSSLLSFKLRPDGTVDPPTTWATDVGESPDGLATDICGNVYVADSSGDPLVRVLVNGRRVETIMELDGARLSALAFGSGRQGWDERTLYGVSESRGGLYEIPLGIRGAPLRP